MITLVVDFHSSTMYLQSQKFLALVTTLKYFFQSVRKILSGPCIPTTRKKKQQIQKKIYRPITCLSITYKMIRTILKDRIVKFLEYKEHLPFRTKNNQSYGWKDQLLKNKIIMENCRSKQKSKHGLTRLQESFR